MKSWTNWQDLTEQNISIIPQNSKGIYVIRKTKNVGEKESDIIYIGQSGTGNQGIGKRFHFLFLDLCSTRDHWKYHSASQKIKKYLKHGLQFSWVKCNQHPEAIEKSFLIAFLCSTGKLPKCNNKF